MFGLFVCTIEGVLAHFSDFGLHRRIVKTTGPGLDENMIGDLGASALAEVLTSSSRMKRLPLGGSHIGESGVEALANALSGH